MSITPMIDDTISYDKVINRRKVCQVHFHDTYELYYLLDGQTKYFIGDEIFLLRKGDFIFVPKRILHRTDSEECTYNERILLSFDDDMIDAAAAPLLKKLFYKKLIHIPSDKRYLVEDILHRLQKEFAENYNYQSLMIRLGISELLVLLCRWGRDYQPHLTETDKAVQAVSEYISENYGEDLSLKTLSRLFMVSESHLSRRFKAFSGMGLNEYIKYVRIYNAAKMLEETTASITEISFRCGFNDSNYFANVFKKIKGITPYRYANQFRSKALLISELINKQA